jgi:hypothetical protein
MIDQKPFQQVQEAREKRTEKYIGRWLRSQLHGLSSEQAYLRLCRPPVNHHCGMCRPHPQLMKGICLGQSSLAGTMKSKCSCSRR